jgi:asparagine synthase (glutamine-hydrolysing)
MQNQLLRDADVMSMQHGVEIRVPFVSSEVVSTAFKTAESIKFTGRSNKQLLAETFAQDLPAAIQQRKKMGFGFPFAEWLKGSDFVQNILQNSNAATKLYQQKFLSGHLHWAQFMNLLIIEYRMQYSVSNR